ncbi:YIP1 family protein [Vibrio intestinalis]|uniref:YIP1 family protein n=1 Tax=Vibrio intestinalis TaxID=2933291 RepID=UPI0021A5355C|nr:YIP1 family protein [Vibrio intestinalis]
MTPSSNPLMMLVDIFRSPSVCFLALYQRGMWGWQPFIFLLLSPFLFWGAYFDIVDFEWLKSGLMPQLEVLNAGNVNALDADTLMASEIINDVIGRITNIVLLAFWFMLATKPSQHQHGYWKWFAASSAIMFPAVIGDLASYISVLLKHGAVMSYAADLNSLNGLIKLPMTSEWFHFASSLPLLMPWYIALGYAAVGTWTEFERGQALAISALPWLAYYLIWALYLAIF